MAHINKKVLNWRSHQKKGSIMKPETFKEIEKEGDKEYGKGHGAAVAGAAYWKTVKAKYRTKHESTSEGFLNYVLNENEILKNEIKSIKKEIKIAKEKGELGTVRNLWTELKALEKRLAETIPKVY